jgi:hypothetical protein
MPDRSTALCRRLVPEALRERLFEPPRRQRQMAGRTAPAPGEQFLATAGTDSPHLSDQRAT